MDLVYILTIGGVYGVLSNVGGYRKLVDKTARFIKKNDVVALLIATFVIALYTSITNDLLMIIGLAPFIVTSFLKAKKDRLTALSAGFGGLFIGLIGKTFGTFGVGELLTGLKTTPSDLIVYKLILFVLAYGLYNLFAVMHMRKTGDVDDTKYDAFCTESLDERKVKPNKKKKVWPLILIAVIVILIGFLGFIDWETSFGVKVFANAFESIGKVELFDRPIITNLLGSVTAFGKWTPLYMAIIAFFGTMIVALIDRMGVSKFITNFQNGVRKIYKLAFIYVLVNCVYVLFYYFPIGITILNALLGKGSFNVLSLFIVGFVGLFLAVDYELVGSALASYLAVLFAEKAAETTLVLYLGMSIAAFIVPTSYILMLALTYLDIPYTKWLKYIWKFLLTMVAAALIVILLVCVF
jgi:uncharacterized ion transporter superfamily protein YfcC